MQSTESDYKVLTLFTQIRRPFMDLSKNMQQLPKHFVTTSACDFIINNSIKNTLLETNFYDGL